MQLAISLFLLVDAFIGFTHSYFASRQPLAAFRKNFVKTWGKSANQGEKRLKFER
jgi:hypothetical protein